jgi:hypothetical protein
MCLFILIETYKNQYIEMPLVISSVSCNIYVKHVHKIEFCRYDVL